MKIMNYAERLQNVTILGANGKMGSGILLLTAMEMADLSMKPENKDKSFVIYAMARRQKALSDLMTYIQEQVVKAGEKKTGALRKVYADRKDLIENSDVINQYAKDVMSIVRPVTTIESAYESTLIFEAISENPELKIEMITQIEKNNKNKPWYFTNTSSIPIGFLDKGIGLEGRILGTHFYNPPAVQKLVEVIKSEKTKPELCEFATQYIKAMKKIEVPSNDFAGFIGNGHFMRDALHGMQETAKLEKEMSFVEAAYIMNKISQDYLIRPMGIYQLIDYVGIDVCQYIMKVMKPQVKNEDIHSPLLDRMIEIGVKGGQNADGSQKDGFLKYDKNKVVGIYDPDKKQYVQIADVAAKCDSKLGAAPASILPWKSLVGSSEKDEILKKYYSELKSMDTLGAKLAVAYAKRSKEIGQNLVKDKVAFNEKDVNTVLLTGFFHAYGPINDYIN
jgi:3-hydroxyacyl-CoA dehydrogenase